MKVLGSYLIGVIEQRKLVDGMTLDLPREAVMASILARAMVGDVLWVKEPWALLISRAHGPQNIYCAVPGPVGTRPPGHIAKIAHLLRPEYRSALALARDDSRITLEILSLSDTTVQVRVHFQQVDQFLKAKAAA